MDDYQKWAIAFLTNRQMEHTQRYLSRGRELGLLTDAELTERWVAVFRCLASNPDDHLPLGSLSDLEGEFAPRKRDPPHELVSNELEAFTKARLERLADNPAEQATVGRLTDEKISELVEGSQKSLKS